MKKMLSGLVLASTFVLTACGGGDSDSSAPTNTNNTNTSTTNPQPNPTTNPTKPNTTKTPACEVKGTNVYIKEGSSCSYSNPAKGINISSMTCEFQDSKRTSYFISFKGKVSNIAPMSSMSELMLGGYDTSPTSVAGISYICK